MPLFFLAFLLLFAGCSIKNYTQKESYLVTIKSPKIRFSDIGYIRHDGKSLSLELYSTGVAVEEFEIATLICTHNGCMSKSAFNKEYLSGRYGDDFLKNILMRQAIFGGANLKKTEHGFEQKIVSKDYDIIYKVNKKQLFFKDRKNHILIKLKRIE